MKSKIILRDQVRAHLLDEMTYGKLEPGKTINLAALARKLDVSVTPIREALTQLQQSMLIKAIPNRGFIIAELNYSEAKDLYELVADLEVLALENSVFEASSIQALKQTQIKFKNAKDTLSRIHAKLEFHNILTQHYKNALAHQILTDLKTRIIFYERAFMSDDSIYAKSDNQHDGIISAIEDDNVPTAALVLKMNWMLILDYIQKQLRFI
ncbi:GntR family transcriptional regulator [Maribacter sp. ANRC-HE7]|uniref:GntR family transcriptional regulator n=1 Tax=Maribacter aquimaris TaxID=2737171 RepID=A0ABR7UXH6_9FLAO|nr:GntR family transcriptional regulator [Maribacter aquimaris]MBD0776315.1 GntR family transcriptional regulator [Maribacter aquimaris]